MIYGIVTNEALRSAVRVTVIATGFERDANGNGAAGVARMTGAGAAGAKAGNDHETGGFMRRMWRRGGEKN